MSSIKTVISINSILSSVCYHKYKTICSSYYLSFELSFSPHTRSLRKNDVIVIIHCGIERPILPYSNLHSTNLQNIKSYRNSKK